MHAASRSVRRDAGYYLKIAAGLARYQLSPPQADPVQAIREQMQVREERFLDLARSVLAQRENVYGQLFDNAGCTFGDLQREIRETGLRTTLGRLMSAGVYITHEELIGRREIVRSGRHIRWHPGDLDNPHGRGARPE